MEREGDASGLPSAASGAGAPAHAVALPSTGLDAVVVRLCRTLRERGVSVTPTDSIDAARTLPHVDLGDREDVRLALRAVLVSRPEDFETFDAAFEEAWQVRGGLRAPLPGPPGADRLRPPVPLPTRRLPPVSLRNWMKPEEGSGDEDPLQMRSASNEEALAARDFAAYAGADDEAFRRLAARIARRLALRRSRRWRSARRGERIDLRRTLRSALRTGGDPIRLERRSRKLRRTRLVALCDVSGSMELYARFLLQFLHALQNTFASVETFVFATRLSRITGSLRGMRYGEALRELARDVRDWSGGTRIGDAVRGVVMDHREVIDRRTVIVILSDGWEVGDPERLADAMRDLHRRAGRVIWLNPLMGAADFAPATRGMQAALPYVDVLAPGHSLDALASLVRHLAV